MKIISEFKVSWNKEIVNQKQFFTVIADKDNVLVQHKHVEAITPSSTSVIISKLLMESKNNDMMRRLKVKLGLTKEEIHKIVSEL